MKAYPSPRLKSRLHYSLHPVSASPLSTGGSEMGRAVVGLVTAGSQRRGARADGERLRLAGARRRCRGRATDPPGGQPHQHGHEPGIQLQARGRGSGRGRRASRRGRRVRAGSRAKLMDDLIRQLLRPGEIPFAPHLTLGTVRRPIIPCSRRRPLLAELLELPARPVAPVLVLAVEAVRRRPHPDRIRQRDPVVVLRVRVRSAGRSIGH
jgi:hypothetical protein